MSRSIAIVGVGNILAGDDGIGAIAAQSIEERFELPEGVRVLEVGTLGPDALALLRKEELVVLLDAVRGGGPPGSIYRLDLEDIGEPEQVPMSVHELGIQYLLREARALGRPIRGVLLGVEPADVTPGSTTLSPPVAEIVPVLQEAALEEARSLLKTD